MAIANFIDVSKVAGGSKYRFMPTYHFSPSGKTVIDVQNDQIIIDSGHGLSDGTQVKYEVGAGQTAIGGLTAGATYYVKRVSDTTIQLSQTLGGASLNITSDGRGNHQFTEIATTFEAENHLQVDLSRDQIFFSTAHGLTNGVAVRYEIEPGETVIGGLTVGNTYYVKVINNTAIQLTTALGGSVINLTSDGSGIQRLTRTASNFQAQNTLRVDVNQDRILFASAHRLADGAAIRYEIDPGQTAIGGLTVGNTYYVKRISDTAIQLTTTSGGTAINLTTDGIGNHRLVQTGAAFDADNQLAVDVATNTLILPSPVNLKVGEAVQYRTGGTQAIGGLQDGATYYVVSIQGTALQLATSAKGTPVDLTAAGGAGNHSFVRMGVEFLASNDTAQQRLAAAVALEQRLSNDLGVTVNLKVGNATSSNDPNADQGAIATGRKISFRDVTVIYDEQQQEKTKLLAGITNGYAFMGTGYGTDAETGIKITDTNLGLALYKTIDYSKPLTEQSKMTYALVGEGTAALVGIDDLTLEGTLEVQVNRTGKVVDERITTPGGEINIELDAANLTRVAGTANLNIADTIALSGNFGIEQTTTKLLIGAKDVEVFIGSGYETPNEIGVKLTNGSLAMVLETQTNSTPAKYALEASGTASLKGIPDLTLEGTMKARINRMGGAVNQTITLANSQTVAIAFSEQEATLTRVEGTAHLKVAGVLEAEGSVALTLGDPDPLHNGRRTIEIAAADVSTFVGIGADTPDTKDDIGAKLSNGDLSLTVNTDDTYNYTIDNAQIALVGIDLFKFSGTASAKGDHNSVSLQLDQLNLSISDYARLTGNFSFNVSSTDGTQIIELGSVNASAFVGIGASTPDQADDVGLKLSNVNSTVQIKKSPQGQSAFAYSMSGDVALFGINGLSLGGHVSAQMNKTGANVTLGGVTIATGVNQVSGTGLNLSIADLTTLSGDLTFNIRESDGAMLAAGKNLSATVSLADGMSGSLSDGNLGLVLLSGGRYALQGNGKATLTLNDLIFTGDLGVEVNRTGKVLNETINLGSQSVAVKFASAANVSRFNASNLDLVLTQSIKDALLTGADRIIDLKNTLVPKYDKDGKVTSESPLSVALPGTDVTLDSMLGISSYMSLGDAIKGYLSPTTQGTTQLTLQGLLGSVKTNWLEKLPVPDGLQFVLNKTGFTISYAADRTYQRAIKLAANADLSDFGVELVGDATINLGIQTSIDLDLSFDWSTFTSNFNLNKLAFNATGNTKDLMLGAYFGPLEMSIGSNDPGKEKGQAQISLGGSISYENSSFKVQTTSDRLDVMLPFYASLAGRDLSQNVTPKAYLNGQFFGKESIKFRHENFDKLLNFRNFGVGDVIATFKDLVTWAEDYRDYDVMQTDIPLTGLKLGNALDFASAFDDQVLSRIDINRPRVDLFSGKRGNLSNGQLTVVDGKFSSDWVGKEITINGVGTFGITKVKDANTLELKDAGTQTLNGQDFVVHQKRELIRTYQELIVAINKSGILPVQVPLVYDPVENTFTIPFSFHKDMSVLNNLPLNLGMELGSLKLSTEAKAALLASVEGRMDLVIDFDGATGKEGLQLFVDNVELKGAVNFDVNDLTVAANLGFLGITAGGAGTNSQIHLGASISTGLDRDLKNNTPGDRRFSLNDLVSGELLDSFYINFNGDAYARLGLWTKRICSRIFYANK